MARIWILVLFFIALCGISAAQSGMAEEFKPDPVKEQQFLPYLAVRHGGPEKLAEWKKSNQIQYYKELWYYCESFYVRKNHLESGEELNPALIDISRFEHHRKTYEESIVIIPGLRDVIVLLPGDKLKHRPE